MRVERALRGLTWDHPRGYLVLDELTRLDKAGIYPYGLVRDEVTWDRQPLKDFEAIPLRFLADDYDLLVVDHPSLGEAVEDGALFDLEELFSVSELNNWRARTIGASFDSYCIADRQWALPIDAASQVGVRRASLVEQVPKTWYDACDTAREVPTVLCLGGPHAFLMFQAVCVALGKPLQFGAEMIVDSSVSCEALAIMAKLLRHSDEGISILDPIHVLESMSAGGAAYCPLVFGYVTYESRQSGSLSFFDAPQGPSGKIGSVLGGAGIAVSARTQNAPAASDHIRRLLDTRVQQELYLTLGGQSADIGVWSGAVEMDSAACHFYVNTRRTMEEAWIRPRETGYAHFQSPASRIVREGLLSGDKESSILGSLFSCYEAMKVGQA